jgi:exonuclease SbcC
MKILTVEWKNFNSYGNSIQTIDFDNDLGELYLLLGGNGHGKSTISEVITFALYGKIERKNKSDLPNRINKNLWCRIRVRSKNKIIEITRGVSPNLFEVNIDGNPYDTAGNTNVQDYLELEIFDIPYQVFKNIIVLSINDFRSFLTMSPGDKRNIVDRLFGFTVINQMKDRISKERKQIKDNLKTISDELGIIDESIDSINIKIQSLQKDKKEDKLKLAKEYRTKIMDLLAEKKKLDESLQKLKDKEVEYKTNQSDIASAKSSVSYDLQTAKKQINLYDHSKCPTCSSDLNTEQHHEIREYLEKTIALKTLDLEAINESFLNISTNLTKLSTKISELNDNSIRTNMRIQNYKKEVETILAEQKETDIDYLNQLITENLDKKIDRNKKQIKNQSDDNFLDAVELVLGEDGVKNLAMKTILPTLNQTITNMANQIHLPYSIKFDDKFNCIVNALGEEINPRSMSTGERKKADFIIIIAMLKLLKIRYPSLNILFLDEIFSSVDSAGIYEIVKILNEVSKENRINTWVINHTELPTELFDKRVEAIREGGFSKLIIEKIS